MGAVTEHIIYIQGARVCLSLPLSFSLPLSPSPSSLPSSLQSYSHNFLVAHGAHITEGEEEASLTATPSVTSGPKMSTPRALLGSREDVYESDAVKEEEGEGDKWQAVAEKIDPDNLLGG